LNPGMKNKKLFILFLITIAVIITAGITAKMRAPRSSLEKDLLYPDLSSQFNKINKINITAYKNTVDLAILDGNWVVTSLDNYPANFNKVRTTVINLSEFRIVDEKTDNPDLYTRLGVEDPETENSTSLLITLFNNTDQAMASVIIGQQRQSSGSKPGMYIRNPEKKQALLVEGILDISANDIDWINRELFHIPSEQVKNVKIQYPDSKIFEINKSTQAQPDFEIIGNEVDIPSASKIIINRNASGLEETRADGVQAVDNFSFPENAITTTVTTFDGMVISTELVQLDEHSYAHFSFSVDPEIHDILKSMAETSDQPVNVTSIEQQIRQWSDSYSSWVYKIPDFKYEALTTDPESIKDLLQSIKPGENN
jgi:outer membrane lipoprotein-sorting protein